MVENWGFEGQGGDLSPQKCGRKEKMEKQREFLSMSGLFFVFLLKGTFAS